MQPMTAEERVRAIVELVRRDGFQAIDSLAEQYGVTPQTIRRDVNLLCDRGLLRRRHGGVEWPAANENLAYPARQVLNIEAKRQIAALVAAEVPASSSLFFGIGTTPETCAQALADHQGLRVMTNNLNVAVAFSRNPSCEVIIAGGKLRIPDHDVIGGDAIGFFDRFSVDIGIYGVGGVDESGALLDFNHEEVSMRQSLMQNCRQRFLVLDHSKFGRRATVRGGHISEAHVVFTDRPLPRAIADRLAADGVRAVVAYPGQNH
jgi:DeoR family glycerol-3-phosphate regulon repressor